VDNKEKLELSADFIRLLTGHQAALLGFIYSLVPNWSDAEDLLQQTSVVLWEKFAEFRPGTDFGRWACTIARFKVMNFLKSKGRDRHFFSPEIVEQLADQGEESLAAREAERKALSYCLEKLPTKERQMLMEYYSGRMPVKDLADKREVTPFAIYKAISRLREALLGCIERRLALEGMR
jgi:RNA polymerase sigma-70 factor (ECF subfamily)